ncbi:hypothetical protein WAI87_21455, partial [Acinetobacter baumannii]
WIDKTGWFGWHNCWSKLSNLTLFLVCSAWQKLKTSRISPCNGQVVFFEKNTQKISTFPPLHGEKPF